MTKLAKFVLRHRKLVIILWLIALAAGGATSSLTTNRLSFDFSLPGQAGYQTAKKVLADYGVDTQTQPEMFVLAAPAGSTVSDADAHKTFAAVQTAMPQIVVVDKQMAGGNPIFSTKDGRAQFAYAFLPTQKGFASALTVPLQKALTANAPAGLKATLSGIPELESGGSSNKGPGVLVETLFGGLGALAVLAFVFASFLALLPLAIAAVAICSTFLILLLITTFADVSFIVQFLVSLVGLGVAIDYSLLLVTRWREERDHGLDNEHAVIAAMETAGHAVVFSGLTVAIGLLALVVIPVPFLQSIGYGGMLIPLVSVAVTMTFLPAILGGIGPKIDWPKIRHESKASTFWTWWGGFIVRRRWIAAAFAIAVLVALIIPATGIKIGNAQSDSLASGGDAYNAIHLLEQGGMPKGALTPIQVVANTNAASATAQKVAGVKGIVTTFAPTGDATNRNGTNLVFAIPQGETSNNETVQVVRDVKTAVKGDTQVLGVSGFGSLQLDYISGVYSRAPFAIGIILLIAYILLVRAFRSVLLPLKAVILNIASLAATFGGLVLFWQQGHGSNAIYGIPATGAITFWEPIMVFAFLFGLSMDYEVFILSRVREEYDASGNTHDAVVIGTGRTGRLVTSAALILFLAFLSLSTGPQTDIKLFATGLGFGILLDATIVRMLLVPALVSLFGSWNWYCPDWVTKVLFIKPPVRSNPD